MRRTRLLLSVLCLICLARPVAAQSPGRTASSWLISVSGGISRSAEHINHHALLTVVVAFDRLLMPRLEFARPSFLAMPPAGPVADDVPEAEVTDVENQAAEAPEESAIQPFTNHSFARRLVAAALSAAGSSRSEQRLSALASRARTSAALPEVRLRAARKADESLRLSPTESDPYRYTQSDGNDLLLEARLTWRLDRLVFSEAELRVEALRMQQAQRHGALVKRVLSRLFAWQRALVTAKNREASPERRSKALLEQLQAEAELDVLTAGWFSEQLIRALLDP